MTPAKLLLPGKGEGRNAVYAAKKGWDIKYLQKEEISLEEGEYRSGRAMVIRAVAKKI